MSLDVGRISGVLSADLDETGFKMTFEGRLFAREVSIEGLFLIIVVINEELNLIPGLLSCLLIYTNYVLY